MLSGEYLSQTLFGECLYPETLCGEYFNIQKYFVANIHTKNHCGEYLSQKTLWQIFIPKHFVMNIYLEKLCGDYLYQNTLFYPSIAKY